MATTACWRRDPDRQIAKPTPVRTPSLKLRFGPSSSLTRAPALRRRASDQKGSRRAHLYSAAKITAVPRHRKLPRCPVFADCCAGRWSRSPAQPSWGCSPPEPCTTSSPRSCRTSQTLRNVELQEPLYVYASDGRLMALFGETRRYPVEIAKVPERVKQAFIAIEDNRFYQHHGVDYKGIGRAIWLLATTNDKRVPGGSHHHPAGRAPVLPQLRVQLYAQARRDAAGDEDGARAEQGRDLRALPQQELLRQSRLRHRRGCGVLLRQVARPARPGRDRHRSHRIPKFPSSGNPISNPERARERRDYVLQRMRETRFHRRRRRDRRAGDRDARHAARASGRGLRAVRRGNGAPGNDRALRRRCAHQGLPRHDHDRPDAAGRGGPGRARRPDRLRPPPRLEQGRAAFRPRRGRGCRDGERALARHSRASGPVARRRAACRQRYGATWCWPTAASSRSMARRAVGPGAIPAPCSSAATSRAYAGSRRSKTPAPMASRDSKTEAAAADAPASAAGPSK